jgi:hypothetical protein
MGFYSKRLTAQTIRPVRSPGAIIPARGASFSPVGSTTPRALVLASYRTSWSPISPGVAGGRQRSRPHLGFFALDVNAPAGRGGEPSAPLWRSRRNGERIKVSSGGREGIFRSPRRRLGGTSMPQRPGRSAVGSLASGNVSRCRPRTFTSQPSSMVSALTAVRSQSIWSAGHNFRKSGLSAVAPRPPKWRWCRLGARRSMQHGPAIANQAPHRHRQAKSGSCRGREPPHARHT